MQPISIIIPTYSAIDYCQLCLESIYQNQSNKENEIILVIDGTEILYKNILAEYKTKLNLKPVIFEENAGLATATNYGFYNASNKYCLNINDDNICPKDFDKILLEEYERFSFEGKLIIPNQIEPTGPSMFKSFIIKDFGKEAKDFDLKIFTEEEQKLRKDTITGDGWTFPLFINKLDYLKVGGMDPYYNSPHVIDWELFLKLRLAGISSFRTHKCNFYHFGSKTARTPKSIQKEKDAHEYAKLKWGSSIFHNHETNEKYLMFIK